MTASSSRSEATVLRVSTFAARSTAWTWTPSWWGSTSGLPRATSRPGRPGWGLHRAARRRRDPAEPPERGAVGNPFGVDFNPTVDSLRIVSDTGQNLRADVTTGTTLVDGSLNYPQTPPAPPIIATGVTGVAYTNNDADTNTATTLYDFDSNLDQVAIQAPANSGSLSPTGTLRTDASDQSASTSTARSNAGPRWSRPVRSTHRGRALAPVRDHAVQRQGQVDRHVQQGRRSTSRSRSTKAELTAHPPRARSPRVPQNDRPDHRAGLLVVTAPTRAGRPRPTPRPRAAPASCRPWREA